MTTSPRSPRGAPPAPSRWANESTSVGRSLPRQSRFSRRITASDTRTRESSAPESRSASSRRRPRRATRSVSVGRRRPRAVTVTVARRGATASLALVGSDDLLHQGVPDHVPFGETDEADAGDVAQEVLRLLQTGRLARGEVDLRHVAGDDRLRAVAETGEEHLHLLGGGVLGLVEDDEGIVQRPAAHEGQRRDLDGAALDQLAGAVEVDHVVQGVVERTQVRVDLLRQVARGEPELLTGFHGRPGEHDSAEAVLHQLRDRHRHGEIGLAGASGTDPEDDVEVADRVDVRLLVDALRRDHALVGRDEDGIQEDVAQPRGPVAGQDAQRVLHVGGVDRIALLEEAVELRERAPGELGLDGVAVQREQALADFDPHAELALEQLHVLVVLTEQLPEEGLVPEPQRDGGDGWLAQDGWSPPAPSSSYAAASAASRRVGSLPPACAKSGRPPPPPPTSGASCLMMFPAWYFPVRSFVTAASSTARSPSAVPSTTTPDLMRSRRRSAISRNPLSSSPSTRVASTVMPFTRRASARTSRDAPPASLPCSSAMRFSFSRSSPSSFSSLPRASPSPAFSRPARSSSSVCSRRTSAMAPCPVAASRRRTPAATPLSPSRWKKPMSPVRRTCVPPHSSMEKSPMRTTWTRSPYLSPKKASAPALIASSYDISSLVTSTLARTEAFTSSSIACSSSSDTDL